MFLFIKHFLIFSSVLFSLYSLQFLLFRSWDRGRHKQILLHKAF